MREENCGCLFFIGEVKTKETEKVLFQTSALHKNEKRSVKRAKILVGLFNLWRSFHPRRRGCLNDATNKNDLQFLKKGDESEMTECI